MGPFDHRKVTSPSTMGNNSSSIPAVCLIFTSLAQRIQNVFRNCCASSQQCKHPHGSSNNSLLDCFWANNKNQCPQISAHSVSSSVWSVYSPQGAYSGHRKPIGTILTLYAAQTMANGPYPHCSGQENPVMAMLGIDFVTEQVGQHRRNVQHAVGTFLEASDHPVGLDARLSSNNLGSLPGQHSTEYNEPLDRSNVESLKSAGSSTERTYLCSKGFSVEQIDTPALDAVGGSPQAEPVDCDKVLGQEFPKATSDHQPITQVASESPAGKSESYRSRRSQLSPLDFEPGLEESPSFHGAKRKGRGSKLWPASKRLKSECFDNMRGQTLHDPSPSEIMQKVRNLITCLEGQLARSKLEEAFRMKESLHRIAPNEWLEKRATPPYSPVPRNHARTTVKWPALSKVLAPTSSVAPETQQRPLYHWTSVQSDSGGIYRQQHEKLFDHMWRVQKICRDQHEEIKSLISINGSLGRRVTALEEQLQVEEQVFRHRTKEMLERARILILNGICQISNKYDLTH